MKNSRYIRLGCLVVTFVGCLAFAVAAPAAVFHAGSYDYSTNPDAHSSYYRDNLNLIGSSVGDMNDGVQVTVGAAAVSSGDPSVGWNGATSTDITFDLGGLVKLDTLTIGYAGIPLSSKWAPDDVNVSFSTDGGSFGPPVNQTGFQLFTQALRVYDRADLVLDTPVAATHVKLSFDGGVTRTGTGGIGYLLDDVSFDGTPWGGSVLPYANNDPDTAVLYHLNETTGLHSKSPGTNFIGDGSGNGQLLRSNYDPANGGSMTSKPTISPFEGLDGPSGLGTSMTQINTSGDDRRAYRVNNADMGVFDTETFTIEAWIRNPNDGAYSGVFRVDNDVASGGLIQFGTDSNGDQLRLAGFFDGGFRAFLSTETFDFEPDTWYHIAVTYDGDGTGNDSEVKFFLDAEDDLGLFSRAGTQLGDTLTDIPDVNSLGTGSGDIFLGEWQNNQYFNGQLDEVRWSNVVRAEFHLTAVPEPSSVVLLGLGVLGATVLFRRRSKSG